MTAQAISALLDRQPGLTADELAQRLGHPRAVIRQQLATLVLRDKTVSISRDGRYTNGTPPAALFEA
jgi:predicted ArsR family transcriptional regulator